MIRTKNIFPALVAVAALAGAGRARGDDRDGGAYWALLGDGKQVTGEKIHDWHEHERRARLEKQRLFEKNHVRLLCHTVRRPAPHGPRVLLANGDVLRGRVTGFLPAEASKNLPDRLVVTVAAPLLAGADPWDEKTKNNVVAHIRADWVQQITFGEDGPRAHRGGVVFFSDGRTAVVSSVRWTPEGIKALAAEEIVSGAFTELAEVHLPGADALDAVVADAVVPERQEAGYVARMQTEGGNVLTYRVAMRRSRGESHGHMRGTYHAVQPTWSLIPLRVPEAVICLRSYRRPDEIPVSLLPAETIEERSFTGYVWPWRRDRSVRGEVMRCGTVLCGLGFGAHSYSAVAFTLPEGARRLSGWVGLDRAAGTGGCVRCEVRADRPNGRRLWRSDLLIGSKDPDRIGPADVHNAKRLVFVTDFAHDGRPNEADPADIRDEVNWMLPAVSVEDKHLHVTRELLDRLNPALAGWELGGQKLEETSLVATAHGRAPWSFAMSVDGDGFTLERTARISLRRAVLDVSATRAENDSGQVVALEIDGEPLKGTRHEGQPLETARRGAGDPAWQRWRLLDRLGKDVRLTLKVARDPKKKPGPIVWRGIALRPIVENLPPGGKIIRPRVLLASLEPPKAVWHPEKKGRKPTGTDPPEARTVEMHGVTLANALPISQGMNLTYKLRKGLRRFVAVVGTENRYHRGPFIVLADGKELHRSGEAVDTGLLEQVSVRIPAGAKTLTLKVEHDKTSGVWGEAGFVAR